MSGGPVCRCKESGKPLEKRRWLVYQRYCNHSAFNGGHYTPSDWSSVSCRSCGATWRTKARYVDQVPDYGKEKR